MNNCEIKTELDRYSDISDLTDDSCFDEKNEAENSDKEVIQLTRSQQILYVKAPQKEEKITEQASCCTIS